MINESFFNVDDNGYIFKEIESDTYTDSNVDILPSMEITACLLSVFWFLYEWDSYFN